MSFYANKHITTGEGGVVLTDNENYYDRICSYRNLFFNNERRFKHYDLGYNGRMTNIQAALGLAQLENIEKNIEIKRLIGNEYQKHLKDIKNIILPIKEYEYAENIYWVFGVLLTDRNYRYMKEIVDKLKQRGVGTHHNSRDLPKEMSNWNSKIEEVLNNINSTF